MYSLWEEIFCQKVFIKHFTVHAAFIGLLFIVDFKRGNLIKTVININIQIFQTPDHPVHSWFWGAHTAWPDSHLDLACLRNTDWRGRLHLTLGNNQSCYHLVVIPRIPKLYSEENHMETHLRDNVTIPGTMLIASLSLIILGALLSLQQVKAGELNSISR